MCATYEGQNYCWSYYSDVFFFQAVDGIRGLVRSHGLGDVYKRQPQHRQILGHQLTRRAHAQRLRGAQLRSHPARPSGAVLYGQTDIHGRGGLTFTALAGASSIGCSLVGLKPTTKEMSMHLTIKQASKSNQPGSRARGCNKGTLLCYTRLVSTSAAADQLPLV